MPKKYKRHKKPADSAKITEENSENNGKHVNIGEKNFKNWLIIKEKLQFKCDRDFVDFLLGLAEKYLCSKLLIQPLEKNSLQCTQISQNCELSTVRQGGDDGESRVLSTVDENAFSPVKSKLSDEKILPVKDLVIAKGSTEIKYATLDNKDESSNSESEHLPSKNFTEERVEKSKNKKKTTQIKRGEENYRKKKRKKPEIELKSSSSDGEASETLNRGELTSAPPDRETVKSKTEDCDEKGLRVCGFCETRHPDGSCPLQTPVGRVTDSQGECWGEDSLRSSRAWSSLPPCLELRQGQSQAVTVHAAAHIPKYTQFGPLVGVPIKEMQIPDDSSMKHIWEVDEGKYLNTEDVGNSNWLRWVRPSGKRENRNVVPVPGPLGLNFITTVALKPGEELLYWAETTGPWANKNMDKTSCGGCNLQFDHAMQYRVHCTVFHEASHSLTVRKYHCKVCGEAVLGKQNIIKHAALYHQGRGAYQCQFCSKFFLRLNYLEMHRNYGCSANPQRARPLCDYCGRKFCQPQKLKVHIKRMHSDLSEVLREFQCGECHKVLGSRAALQRHNKEVHRRPGPAQCAKCSKTFQNRSNLKIHMLTHSGIKPFKCEEAKCGAAFTTKQCLQFHYRKVHGLSESQFPLIVRSVEYTFDAYAGSSNSGHEEGSSGLDEAVDGGEDCSSASEAQQLPAAAPPEEPRALVVTKGSKKWIAPTPSVEEEEVSCGGSGGGSGSTASLLVEAALDAAASGAATGGSAPPEEWRPPWARYQQPIPPPPTTTYKYDDDRPTYRYGGGLYEHHYPEMLRVMFPADHEPVLPSYHYPVSPTYLPPKSPPPYHHHYSTYY